MKRSDVDFWGEFSKKVFGLAAKLFEHPALSEADLTLEDAKVVALLLLARTLSNFDAARMLLREGHVLEARILARCCYENAFWLSALAKRGKDFVDEMYRDHEASILRLAQRISVWIPDDQKTWGGFASILAEAERLKKSAPTKHRGIKHLGAAQIGGMEELYITYARLSSEAAHPSVESLLHHLALGGSYQDFTVHAAGNADDEEITNTLGYCTRALLFSYFSAEEVIAGTDPEREHPDLIREFEELSDFEEGLHKALDELSHPMTRPLSKYARKVAKRRHKRKTAGRR